MLLRATLMAAGIAAAALAMAGLRPGLAHADPNQTCTAPDRLEDSTTDHVGLNKGRVATSFRATPRGTE